MYVCTWNTLYAKPSAETICCRKYQPKVYVPVPFAPLDPSYSSWCCCTGSCCPMFHPNHIPFLFLFCAALVVSFAGVRPFYSFKRETRATRARVSFVGSSLKVIYVFLARQQHAGHDVDENLSFVLGRNKKYIAVYGNVMNAIVMKAVFVRARPNSIRLCAIG